jgi:hypothetical protein
MTSRQDSDLFTSRRFAVVLTHFFHSLHLQYLFTGSCVTLWHSHWLLLHRYVGPTAVIRLESRVNKSNHTALFISDHNLFHYCSHGRVTSGLQTWHDPVQAGAWLLQEYVARQQWRTDIPILMLFISFSLCSFFRFSVCLHVCLCFTSFFSFCLPRFISVTVPSGYFFLFEDNCLLGCSAA